jgi:N-acylneuraminate cytidylyltransferase
VSSNGTVVAIIPARGGSKGIPRKNLKEVGGKPLVAHTIEQSLACKRIHRTIVSSEDVEIRGVGESFGAEVMDRPHEFIHDNSVQEVDRLLRWTLLALEDEGSAIDVVVLLYPTAPLRRVETIDRAVSMVTEGGYDSVLSLYEDTTYLWRKAGEVVEPTNYVPEQRGPRQKESWNQWAENKAVYVVTRDLLVETGCRLGGRIGHVEMSKLESIDVDHPDDLALVDSIYRLQNR